MDIPLYMSDNNLLITSSHQYQKTDGINLKMVDPYYLCNASFCSIVQNNPGQQWVYLLHSFWSGCDKCCLHWEHNIYSCIIVSLVILQTGDLNFRRFNSSLEQIWKCIKESEFLPYFWIKKFLCRRLQFAHCCTTWLDAIFLVSVSISMDSSTSAP